MTRAVAKPVLRVEGGAARADPDLVAREAPLAIDLRSTVAGAVRGAGLLMRTPGDDADLVRGWLYTERIIRRSDEIVAIDHTNVAGESERLGDAERPKPIGERIVVTVAASVALDHVLEHRSLAPTSACGLCGRVAVDRLDALGEETSPAPADAPRWPAALIADLPATLLAAQTVFAATGGLHAAGLFDDHGALQVVREDIGRHNAVDKVIGAALVAGRLGASCPILVVSGRVAFEIVQKAAVGRLAAVVAVGAPSDLAVDAARAAGLTLVGFARDGRFNVYAGAERIATDHGVLTGRSAGV